MNMLVSLFVCLGSVHHCLRMVLRVQVTAQGVQGFRMRNLLTFVTSPEYDVFLLRFHDILRIIIYSILSSELEF